MTKINRAADLHGTQASSLARAMRSLQPALPVLALLSGCVGDPFAEDRERAPIGSSAGELIGTVATGAAGVLDLQYQSNHCSGFILNEQIVVTAAHCQGPWGASYQPPGGTRQTYASLPSQWREDYDWDELAASESDLAIYVGPASTPLDYRHFLRIRINSPFDTYAVTAYGYGYHSHVPDLDNQVRWAAFSPSVESGPFLVTQATDSEALCQIDSGGPQLVLGSSGVLQVKAMTIGGENVPCAQQDDDQRGLLFNESIVAWIEDTSDISCRRFTDAAGHEYARCFDIPFFNEVGPIEAEGVLDRGTATAIVAAVLY